VSLCEFSYNLIINFIVLIPSKSSFSSSGRSERNRTGEGTNIYHLLFLFNQVQMTKIGALADEEGKTVMKECKFKAAF